MLSSRSEGGGDSGGHSGGSGTPEPPIGHPQAPVGAAGGIGGENYGVDGIRVFEVEFPPTGPLGITFEWAADPEARSHGDGGTPVTSPRTHPLGSSTLPPISPSPSSARAGHADHPLRPPVGPALLPHALRIQSFPDLPPIETSTPSATAGAGTTTTAGEESEASIDGETKSTAVTSDDVSGVLRQHPHTSHEPRMYNMLANRKRHEKCRCSVYRWQLRRCRTAVVKREQHYRRGEEAQCGRNGAAGRCRTVRTGGWT